MKAELQKPRRVDDDGEKKFLRAHSLEEKQQAKAKKSQANAIQRDFSQGARKKSSLPVEVAIPWHSSCNPNPKINTNSNPNPNPNPNPDPNPNPNPIYKLYLSNGRQLTLILSRSAKPETSRKRMHERLSNPNPST